MIRSGPGDCVVLRRSLMAMGEKTKDVKRRGRLGGWGYWVALGPTASCWLGVAWPGFLRVAVACAQCPAVIRIF